MHKSSAIIILRWGLAFVFFYAAIASLLRPQEWMGYFPRFLFGFLPPKAILSAFSFYEIVLAALLFSGKKLVWATALAIATFTGIIVFNLEFLDVTFRDVGLIMAGLALLELIRKEKSNREQ